ncbi:MAG: FKBP-type peptidyl-prolyl cis-trans isomerase, partial [Actinomycetota bacterium]|nr:FKBP-type peptidyl-prolyl cis-trans isomerase [Actinomycetota bacterium]
IKNARTVDVRAPWMRRGLAKAGLVTVAFLCMTVALAACGGDDGEGADSSAPDPDCDTETVTTDSGLRYRNIECGEGESAEQGDSLLVHYTGKLADGTEFDSSIGEDPLPITLGTGGAIPGFDEGLRGMQLGGKRELTIPPELGYGSTGSGEIPPNATLFFEVEIVQINEGS